MMKLAYIKNGDVIEQLNRIIDTPARPVSGPDAFLADLLHTYRVEPVLLLSAHHQAGRRQDGRLQAVVFGGHPGAPAWRWAHEFGSVLWRLLRFRPVGILCGRRGAMFWAAFVGARLLSVPIVYSRHDSPPSARRGVRGWLDRLDAAIIRRADACLCHGPYMRAQLRGLGVPEDLIFTFEVATDALAASLVEAPSAPETDVEARDCILYLGRVSEEKGVFELLEAAAGLLARGAHLKYVGDGPAREHLHQRAEALGVGRHVSFTGRVSHEAIGLHLRSARVVAAPTRGACEARSMAVLEALLAGVPVIAPDGGAFPYLIENGRNGVLYETDSLAELGKALEAVWVDDLQWRRLCEGARASSQRLANARQPTFGQAAERAFSSALTRAYEQRI